MAVTLNASTSSGLVSTADTSGTIELQSNGTTVLGVTSTGTSVTGTQSVSGNLSFNSGYGSSAVAYGCRAWVNFNGTGTPAIRASGNVTSITDVGTGQYTINLTNAMPDANFATTVGYSRSYAGFDTADSNRILTVVATTTTSVSVQTTTPPTTLADLAYIGVAVLR
jgi:hypothetical protein